MPDEEAEERRQEQIQQTKWQLDYIKERQLELSELMQLNWQRAQRSLADRLAVRQRFWEARGGRSDDCDY